MMMTMLLLLSGCNNAGHKADEISGSGSTDNSERASDATAADNLYAAYLDVVEDMVSEYGLYTQPDGLGPAGFIRGILEDMDNDGTDELICFYRVSTEIHSSVSVYTYSNGEATQMLNEQSGNGYGSLGVNSGLSLSYMEDKTYLRVDLGNEFNYQHLFVYWLDNGSVMQQEFYAKTELINEDERNVSYSQCAIDGKEVTAEEYVQAYSSYTNRQHYLYNPEEDNFFDYEDAAAFIEMLKSMT